MKTLRSAFLVAGILAALTNGANAQTLFTPAGDLTFSGLFTTDGPDNVPQTADDALGSPGATINISGVGHVSGGTIFSPGPFFGPGGASAYRTGQAQDETGANYTFVFDAGPGTVSAVGTNVVTTYTSGFLDIFFDPTPITVANYNNRGTFGDGTLFLRASINNLRSSFDVPGGQGSVRGSVTFTGGTFYTGFLQPRGLTMGEISSQTNLFNTTNAPGTYDFQADGRLDVIPEPTTMALFATGLLPLAVRLRRRKV